MLEPVVRALTDWFRDHPTYGVNQCIPAIPLDQDSPQLPDIKSFWDETRSREVHGDALPESSSLYPALICRVQNADTLDGRTVHTWQDGTYDFVVEYITREIDGAKAKSLGYNTLRAVLLSIRNFADPRKNPENQEPYRKRNGIHIGTLENPRYVPSLVEMQGGWQAGAILVQVFASDTLFIQ